MYIPFCSRNSLAFVPAQISLCKQRRMGVPRVIQNTEKVFLLGSVFFAYTMFSGKW